MTNYDFAQYFYPSRALTEKKLEFERIFLKSNLDDVNAWCFLVLRHVYNNARVGAHNRSRSAFQQNVLARSPKKIARKIIFEHIRVNRASSIFFFFWFWWNFAVSKFHVFPIANNNCDVTWGTSNSQRSRVHAINYSAPLVINYLRRYARMNDFHYLGQYARTAGGTCWASASSRVVSITGR